MKKWLVVSEKIIAILLILSGLMSVFVMISLYISSIDIQENFGGSFPTPMGWLRRNSVTLFLALFSITGGLLLLLGKRLGWLLAVTTLVASVLLIVYTLFFSHLGRVDFDPSFEKHTRIFLFVALWLLCIFILTRKGMRSKYKPSGRLFAIGATLILLLVFLKGSEILRQRANQQRIETLLQDYLDE